MTFRPIALVLFASAAAASPFPSPPRQTASQRALFARSAARARQLSASATPSVIAFIAEPASRAAVLACCGPGVAALSPAELLGRLRDEMAVSELVHNFPAVDPAPRGDVNLSIATSAAFFYNQWQLRMLGILNVTGGRGSPEDAGETGIFGCDEFPAPEYVPKTWAEASSRVVYTAVNTRRIDLGNPIFGDVSVVFNRTELKDMILIAPLDSGIYEMSCNKSGPATAPGSHHMNMGDCAAWQDPTAVGTLDHLDHLLLPSLRFWNSTMHGGAPMDPAAQLGALLGRLLGDWRSAPLPLSPASSPSLPHISVNDVIQYLEANIVGNPPYHSSSSSSSSVSFVIGHFPSLFGTPAGRQLQTWCTGNGWALQWALGRTAPQAAGGHHHWDNSTWVANQRLLDAEVLLRSPVHNRSTIVSPAASRAFASTWAAVAKGRQERPQERPRERKEENSAGWAAVGHEGGGMGGGSVRSVSVEPAQWEVWWAEAAHTDLRVQPPMARSCAAADRCVGVRLSDNSCVCY